MEAPYTNRKVGARHRFLLVCRFDNITDHICHGVEQQGKVQVPTTSDARATQIPDLRCACLSLAGRYSGCRASISINASVAASTLLHSERLCSAIALSASVAASYGRLGPPAERM